MKKIQPAYIIDQYKGGVTSYADFTKEVGLWESEKYVFQKYLKKTDQILDLGCGTGRTTFPLFQMGYQNIIGVDLTPEMIQQAHLLNEHFATQVPFSIGDATDLAFEDEVFDAILFSFNGMMSIPGQSRRDLALREISRVLKPEGKFIFTTHDRHAAKAYLAFWAEEKARWDAGLQNARLYEFGDLITTSKNEPREIYIHIPTVPEVAHWLDRHHFTVMETFYRSDQFDEPDKVKEKSGECRFWIARKS